MRQSLPWSAASERNREPILEALRAVLPARGRVLEVGSGTGQHVVWFAAALPQIQWQPSDQAGQLADLGRRIALEGSPNILPPCELDVAGAWPHGPFDAVYSANTAHIMSWPEVEAMYAGVGRVLVPGGVFCLYGPFHEHGAATAPGNAAFDRDLRRRNPAMGVRDSDDLEALAGRQGLQLTRRFALPANNQLLVFERVPARDQVASS